MQRRLWFVSESAESRATDSASARQIMRTMFHRFSLALPFLTLVVVLSDELGQLQAKERTITVVTNEYPPYHDPHHKDHGLSFVIIRSIFGQAGITVKEKFLPTNRLIAEMLQGHHLAMLGNKKNFKVEDLEQMEEVPYQLLRLVLYYRKNQASEFANKPLASLAGKRAAVIRSSVTSKMFEDAGIKVTEVELIDSQFRMLAAGRVDMISVLDLTALEFLNSSKGQEFKDLLESAPKAIKTISGSIIFDRRNPDSREFAAIFRRELAVYRTKETYRTDLQKYYGEGELPIELLDYVKLRE